MVVTDNCSDNCSDKQWINVVQIVLQAQVDRALNIKTCILGGIEIIVLDRLIDLLISLFPPPLTVHGLWHKTPSPTVPMRRHVGAAGWRSIRNR